MQRSPLRLVLTIAALLGLAASLVPLWPVLERTAVRQTRLQRVDHTQDADFARGELDGVVLRRSAAGSSWLTLAAPGEGTYVSPPVDLSLPATSLAAHWIQRAASEPGITFELRGSVDGRAWSAWQEVEAEGGAALAEGRQVFSGLATGDGARFVQYRVHLSGSGPALPAVRAVSLFGLDSATPPEKTVLRLRWEPPSRAQAAIKPLGIVSRQQWGADESLRFEASADQQRGLIWPEEVQAVEKIVVHHTAGANVCSSTEVYCQRRSVVAINDIYHYHTVANGWGDIGYNSLIGYDGRIYEGRHGPEPIDATEPLQEPVVAGHALGFNQRTHGISLMGDFEQQDVPNLQYQALVRMMGWIVRSQLVAGGAIDPLGSSNYVRSSGETRPALPNIVGHRDVNDTECPGEFMYRRLADLREQTKRFVEWPPVRVELQAQPQGNAVAYHILVDNHEPELVEHLTIKGAVPANAELVDSWAGSPNQNRGVFDGSVVTWNDPDAALSPGRDRREYAFIVRPRPGVARSAVRTTAWAEFTAPEPGIAVSAAVSADQRAEAVADAIAGGRVGWRGDWAASRNVANYYGDGYQVHPAGEASANYAWEADLPVAGSYEVFAWWTAGADRATNAPYTVQAQDGPHTVRVNQQEPGGKWVSLGVYDFAAGPARLTLSADADGYVIADAVRFQQR